jgi:hypothetical protein
MTTYRRTGPVVKTTARTDSTNLRLYYAAGVVIFNWEKNPETLRVHDPLTNQRTGVRGKGNISTNEWNEIEWKVLPERMEIRVNGRLRHKAVGDFKALKAPIGIGPAFGSKVSVKSFQVTPLKPAKKTDKNRQK